MKKFLIILALLLFPAASLAQVYKKAQVPASAQSINEIKNAAEFSGTDIGAKINTAIDSFSSGKEGTVIVPPASWCGASYGTMISLDRPVTVMFPGSTCQATYTGAVAALKQTGAGSRGKTMGFGVSESGNANSNVDGILIDATDAQLTDCAHSWFRISQTVRHGINLEAKDNGIYQCEFSNGRITAPGGDNIIIDSTGTAKANSNAFNKLTLNTTPASHNALRVADGYANSFRDVYIQGGNATAQAIYISGDFELFENVTIDADMTLGIKTDAGNHVFTGLQNNASGTAETVSGTGKINKFTFAGQLSTNGQILINSTNVAVPSLALGSATSTGIYNASDVLTFASVGVAKVGFGANFNFASDVCARWSSTTSPGGAFDLAFCREGTGVLYLKNNTDAGTTSFGIFGDRGDDAADKFYFDVNSSDNLIIRNSTNTRITITSGGEVNISTISGDGTGKAVCIKSDGNLGTCTDAVGGGGTCTCS